MSGNWNSGRRRMPTNLQVLRGKQKPRSSEPSPTPADASFDEPPTELEGDTLARAEWARVAPMLRLCGLISQAERSTLIAVCQQWSIYLEAQGKVRSLGMIVKRPNGVPVTNPYFAIADRALKQCRNFWNELGLTPSGRSRLSALADVASPKERSKWAGLL